MSDKEHKASRILELNPRDQVPTFKDQNIVINESFATCRYLTETYRDQPPHYSHLNQQMPL